MTLFTSAISGNWNDGASWGMSSPGIAGIDYPGIDGDTINIKTGHTISYNAGINTTVFGSMTVNGSLIFPINASSDLLFGSGTSVTISSTGSIIAGTESAPVGANYKCRLLFLSTATAFLGLITASGATLSFYGSDDYGGNIHAELDADWTSGQSFVVKGDRTGWKVGSLIGLSKNTTYGSYATDIQKYTILSRTYDSDLDKTTIVINEAAPGVTFFANPHGWQNLVFNLSRNVFIGAETYAVQPKVNVKLLQNADLDRIHFKNVQFQIYEVSINYGLTHTACNHTYDRCTFIKCSQPISYIGNPYVKDCVFFDLYKLFGYAAGVSIENSFILGSYYGASVSSVGRIFEATFVSCSYALYYNVYNAKVVIANCYRACDTDAVNMEMAVYNTNNLFKDNEVNVNLYAKDCLNLFGYNCTGYVFGEIVNCTNIVQDSSRIHFTGKIDSVEIPYIADNWCSLTCDNTYIDGVFRPYTVASWFGTITSIFNTDAGWEIPPSGNTWELLFTPNGYTSSEFSMVLSTRRNNSVPVTAAHTNFSVKVRPTGFTIPLTNKELCVELFLVNSSGVPIRNINSETTYTNGSWNTINIPIPIGTIGYVYWNITLIVGGGTLLVDPIVSIS